MAGLYSVSKPSRILKRSGYLRLLSAFLSLLALLCQAGYAQDCAQCAANAVPDPVSTGEWLLTKQVNEVNVFFVAAHKNNALGDLTQNDISVRDDNKPPLAILAFRTERQLP